MTSLCEWMAERRVRGMVKKRNNTKSYEGSEVVENRIHPFSEETHHIEEREEEFP